jgi:prepilin-type N-terminal cleavage/methylation domain-containing protein
MRCTLPHGFTLIELLLTLAVLALLATSATPSLLDLLDRHRLRGAAENIHGDLMLARTEALRLNTPVSISFQVNPADGVWCYALNDAGPCDCLHGNDCRVAGSPAQAATNAYFQRVRLSTNLRLRTATFQPVRGTVNAGTVTLAIGAQAVDIVISTLGRVRLCSDQLVGYPPC